MILGRGVSNDCQDLFSLDEIVAKFVGKRWIFWKKVSRYDVLNPRSTKVRAAITDGTRDIGMPSFGLIMIQLFLRTSQGTSISFFSSSDGETKPYVIIYGDVSVFHW
jgi:hypothetical protein